MPTATAFFSKAPEHVSRREEARFFGQLKTANDTFKRTQLGRLSPVDRWLVRQLGRAGSSLQSVLDIGISSGVTTLEMAAALKEAGHPLRVTGTDRALKARLLRLTRFCRVLTEPDGHILQYDIFGVAIQPWIRRLDFVNGMFLVRLLLHRLLDRRVRARIQQGEGRSVVLVSPRLAGSRLVELVESDVTVPDPCLTGRFDLVRAANILNRHYFTPADLQRAVSNVRSYLRGPGAWLLVMRTMGEDGHDATLMRLRDDGRLAVVARYGGGSEVEDLFAG